MAQPRDVADAPRIDDPEGIALLRTVLLDAGYTPAGVRDRLSTEVGAGRDSAELPLYLHMLRDGGRLETLIKLFLLDVEVPASEAVAAFDPLPLSRLEGMGLLRRVGEMARPAVELAPTENLLLACDPFGEELAKPDHVLGPSPPARVLAWLTVRRPVERALDLGSGNGHQALLAAAHANHVTAVDINARALRFAAFNAVLNQAPSIELRQGDLFEPVAGEEFDLVVCNPPYVVSPETEIAYRDGGLRGDAFCERIIRELPAHLAPGGFGQVLVSWIHPLDGDWTAPVRSWVEGSGCDAVLLRYAMDEPLDYAAAWNRPLRPQPELYGEAIGRWASYFDELGVGAISWGALTLRRRKGPNWFFPFTSPTDRIASASDQMLRLFDGQDFLARSGDGDLLATPFSVASDHRIEQTIRLQGGGEMVERNVLRLDAGLRFEVSIDAATERVLALFDGERTLGEALAQAAGEFEAPLEAFTTSALPILRRMVELGFVSP